ncbi:DinB family protein [Daejeonella sp.]|uniref:DinB family protein n=1 Tax=Daejeonella sp. TaxID=2805397 RepID=UPI0030C49FBF
MELKTKSARMATIPALYDMQTTFFNNALEGISDKDAHSRLDTKANHIAWLAGSLVQQRYELARDLDKSKSYKQQADDLFKDNQGIKEGVTYPSLEQFKKDWKEISPILRELLVNADDAQLNKKIEMPGMEFPLFDLITFVSYREANCIGQIAL